MVQVWTNGEDSKNLENALEVLEASTKDKESADLKAFVMVVTDPAKMEPIGKELTSLAEKLKIERTGLTYLSKDNHGVSAYKINLEPDVKNTVFVYRRKKVTDKFVNLTWDEKGISTLKEAIDKVTN
ncbi:MAG TPA: hypothetical protein VK934_13695 [Fimbriimonas sp.]|nr:hypothetical protein [Fimbriimonas sp.]